MSTSTSTLMTADELLQLTGDRHRYELINGELKAMSPAGHNHGRITMRIASPLAQFVWKNKLGEVFAAETGFKLTSNPDTVLAPDVAFVSKARVKKLGGVKGYWPGPPDVAMEVVSPNERKLEANAKVEQWLRFGTKEVWVVDCKHEKVTIYRSADDLLTFTNQEALISNELLPGFRIPLSDIFGIS